MKTTIPAALVAAFLSAAAPAEADGSRSLYTGLKDCTIIDAIPEEAGYLRSRCDGPAGYALELVEADARHNLMIIPPEGETHNLNLPSRFGGGFSSLGETVEWRGPGRGEAVRPDALIIRYGVVEDGEPMVPVSYLLVVSLGATICLSAVIEPGEDQNEDARAAADGPMECLPRQILQG